MPQPESELLRVAKLLIAAWGTKAEAARRAGICTSALNGALKTGWPARSTEARILAAERAAKAEIQRRQYEERQDPEDRDCGLCGQIVQLGKVDAFATCDRCGRGVDRNGNVVSERRFGERTARRKVAG